MADEITDQLLDAALGPLEAETDAGRMKARSLTELIEADKYLKGIAASAANPTRSAWGMLRPARAVPPDATGRTAGDATV